MRGFEGKLVDRYTARRRSRVVVFAAMLLLLTAPAITLGQVAPHPVALPTPIAQDPRLTSGYWLLGADGGVFAVGGASYYGSTGDLRLNQPIVDMAPTRTGRGYWLVAADGGVFAFGDAQFFGSTGGMRLNQPIVGIEAVPAHDGYWLVAADGGIFAFGPHNFDRFHGSTGDRRLNRPIVGMASSRTGNGYWLVAADGGIFAFGDATFHGSTGGIPLAQPIVDIATTSSGNGYWLAAGDGGVFAFGGARFTGSAETADGRRIQGIAARPSGDGYWMADGNGTVWSFRSADQGGSPAPTAARAVVAMAAQPFGVSPARGILISRGEDHRLPLVLSADGVEMGTAYVPPDPTYRHVFGLRERASLNPDGTHIAMELWPYEKYGPDYANTSRDGADVRFGAFINSPSFSADGRQLALVQRTQYFNQASLFVVDVTTGNGICIDGCDESGRGRVLGTTWSPDNKTIAFALARCEPLPGPCRGEQSSVILVAADGSNRRVLTEGHDPRWSPDGTLIAYTLEQDDGSSEIWAIRPDGTDARRLITSGRNDVPVWSPDGRRIAFVSDRSGMVTTWIANSDGRSPVPLTGRPGDRVLDWR